MEFEDTPEKSQNGKNTGISNFSALSKDEAEPRRGRTEPEAPAELIREESVGVESEPDESHHTELDDSK